jgi:hypothetical protein
VYQINEATELGLMLRVWEAAALRYRVHGHHFLAEKLLLSISLQFGNCSQKLFMQIFNSYRLIGVSGVFA